MNILEVIKKLDGRTDVWFRPISWRQLGCAYALRPNDERIDFVPTAHGGQLAHFPYLYDVLGEWEIVNPHDVVSEKG